MFEMEYRKSALYLMQLYGIVLEKNDCKLCDHYNLLALVIIIAVSSEGELG